MTCGFLARLRQPGKLCTEPWAADLTALIPSDNRLVTYLILRSIQSPLGIGRMSALYR